MPIALQPQARPVDVYAPAEVRQGGDGGSQALQLARALSGFNDSLKGYADYHSQAQQVEAQQAAAQEQLKRQFKSIKDLKSAVDRGEITEDSNPWKQVFLRQLVAKEQVRGAFASIEAEYLKSPARNQDGIEGLNALLDQRLGEATSDLSPWEAPVVMGEVSSFRDGMAQRHISERERVRNASTVIGLRRELGHSLGRAVPLLKSGTNPEAVDSIAAEAQHVLNTSLQVMSPEQVSEQASEVVKALALYSGSHEVLNGLLDKVMVGDKSLRQLALPGEIEQLGEQIDDRIYSEMQRSSAAARQARQASLEAAYQTVGAEMAAAKQAGQPYSLLKSKVDISAYPLDEQVEINRLVRTLQGSSTEAEGAAILAGIKTPEEALSRAEDFIRLNTAEGREAASNIMTLRDMLTKESYPKETDPEVFSRLVVFGVDSTPIAEKVRYLQGAFLDGMVARNDFEKYMASFIGAAKPGDEARRSVLTDVAGNYKTLIRDTLRPDDWLSEDFGPKVGAINDKADLILGPLQAIYESEITANPNITLQELRTKLNTAAESMLKQSGAITEPAAAKEARQLLQVYKEGGAEKAMSKGALSFRDGKFIANIDGVDKPLVTPPKIAPDAKTLIKNQEALVEKLGISSPDERRSLLLSQAQHFSPRERDHLAREVKIQQYGEDTVDTADGLASELEKAMHRAIGADWLSGAGTRYAQNPNQWRLISLTQEALKHLKELPSGPADIADAQNLLKIYMKAQYRPDDEEKAIQGFQFSGGADVSIKWAKPKTESTSPK